MKRLRKLKAILPSMLLCMMSLPMVGPALADKPADVESKRPALASSVIVELRQGRSIDGVNRRYGTATIRHIPGSSIYLLANHAGASDEQMAYVLSGDMDVVSAEPNKAFKSLEAQQFSLAFDGQYSFATPNDEAQAMYGGQWSVYRTRLSEARAIATGLGRTVAIVDTGVAMTHTALLGRFSPAGYDFVDGDWDPSDLPNGIDDDGDGYADEATGHGTFIAGIIALVAPDASIMPLRVLDSDGWGTVYDVAAAIRYAVDNGADVVNVSLGTNRSSRALENAVNYAYAKNVIVIASAGNRSAENRTGAILYPASYKKAISVVATDSDDMKASFSNWGKDADLAAPGAAIYSTYWNGGYAWWSGTSMAAAFVTGGAALVQSLYPSWTSDAVVSRLIMTAANIDSLNYSQYRGKLGAGRIDFYAALQPY